MFAPRSVDGCPCGVEAEGRGRILPAFAELFDDARALGERIA